MTRALGDTYRGDVLPRMTPEILATIAGVSRSLKASSCLDGAI